jgi:hypothetical protein
MEVTMQEKPPATTLLAQQQYQAAPANPPPSVQDVGLAERDAYHIAAAQEREYQAALAVERAYEATLPPEFAPGAYLPFGRPINQIDEASMRILEERIPELAVAALEKARQRALDAGFSVTEVFDNNLVETFPDGTRRIIKPLPPATHVPIGTTRILHKPQPHQ